MIAFVLMVLIPFILFFLLLKMRTTHFFTPYNKKVRVIAVITVSIPLLILYGISFVMKVDLIKGSRGIVPIVMYVLPYIWIILMKMYFYKKAEKNVKVAMKKERNLQRLKSMGLAEKVNM